MEFYGQRLLNMHLGKYSCYAICLFFRCVAAASPVCCMVGFRGQCTCAHSIAPTHHTCVLSPHTLPRAPSRWRRAPANVCSGSLAHARRRRHFTVVGVCRNANALCSSDARDHPTNPPYSNTPVTKPHPLSPERATLAGKVQLGDSLDIPSAAR